MFMASNPASSKNAISVGSVDSTSSIVHYFDISTGQHVPYRSAIPFPTGSFPVYFTSNSTQTQDDACKPLPSSTPDLSNHIVVIRRGWESQSFSSILNCGWFSIRRILTAIPIRTCYFETKAGQAHAKGAKLILFYWVSCWLKGLIRRQSSSWRVPPSLYTQNSTTPVALPNKLSNSSVAVLTAQDGQYLFESFRKNSALRLNFSDSPSFYSKNFMRRRLLTFAQYIFTKLASYWCAFSLQLPRKMEVSWVTFLNCWVGLPYGSQIIHFTIVILRSSLKRWNFGSGPSYDFLSPQPAISGVGGDVVCEQLPFRVYSSIMLMSLAIATYPLVQGGYVRLLWKKIFKHPFHAHLELLLQAASSGTSMASPQVQIWNHASIRLRRWCWKIACANFCQIAGVAALILSARGKRFNGLSIRSRLASTARLVRTDYGNGTLASEFIYISFWFFAHHILPWC
jgi:hypothetical protein